MRPVAIVVVYVVRALAQGLVGDDVHAGSDLGTAGKFSVVRADARVEDKDVHAAAVLDARIEPVEGKRLLV